MGLCLGHPQHGYYMSRDPLGEKGDFITAPEVSQIFGELIAIWCVGAWAAMGSPPAFNLVELGPGRGTLMADMLRTVRKAAPAFAAAASVHLVETSPVLRLRQRDALDGQARWHDSLDDVPDGPMILVANEFFDALPIRQFEKRQGHWHERVMGLEDGGLALGLAPVDLGPLGTDGDVIESAPLRSRIAEDIGSPPGAPSGCRAHHRLRPSRKRARRHAAGHARASLRADHGSAGRLRPDLACGFRGAGQGAFAQAAPRSGPPSRSGRSCWPWGSSSGSRMLALKADAATRAMLERQMTKACSRGPDG